MARCSASVIMALIVVLVLTGRAEARRDGKRGGGRAERQQAEELKPGDPAPDFELKKLDGAGKVKLSVFRGKKPVVLIFGSYT